jgi:hypothetical protein
MFWIGWALAMILGGIVGSIIGGVVAILLGAAVASFGWTLITTWDRP